MHAPSYMEWVLFGGSFYNHARDNRGMTSVATQVIEASWNSLPPMMAFCMCLCRWMV